MCIRFEILVCLVYLCIRICVVKNKKKAHTPTESADLLLVTEVCGFKDSYSNRFANLLVTEVCGFKDSYSNRFANLARPSFKTGGKVGGEE